MRAQTTDHTSFIRNDIPKDGRMVSLIDGVFQHHPAQFSKEAPPAFRPSEKAVDQVIPTQEWVAWEFYTKHYSPVKLHRYLDGEEILETQFLDGLCSFEASATRNEMFFLIG